MLHYVVLFYTGELCSFDEMIGPALHQTVDTVYHETSKLSLQIFDSRYKFHSHLQALRRYLLLGQGDFIRYLMDQLEYVLRVYMCVCVFACICVCLCMCVCVCVYMHACIRVCIFDCVCAQVNIHMHIFSCLLLVFGYY